MEEVLFQQFMQPTEVCVFEHPLVLEAIGPMVDSVRAAFAHDDVAMVTISLYDGRSATFRRRNPGEAIKTPEEVLIGARHLSDGEQAQSMREAAYRIDENIKAPYVNTDGTINFKNHKVGEILKEMGFSGCAQDNACACSDAVHARDSEILDIFAEKYSGK